MSIITVQDKYPMDVRKGEKALGAVYSGYGLVWDGTVPEQLKVAAKEGVKSLKATIDGSPVSMSKEVDGGYWIYPEDGTVLMPASLQGMFRDNGGIVSCESLPDTSRVSDFSWMFSHCSGLEHVDTSGLDTSSATDMHEMFGDCNSLSDLDVSGFDVSKVTNMNDMFYANWKLRRLDLTGWDTSNVTDFGGFIGECKSLESIDFLRGINLSKASPTSFEGMFYYNESLKEIDVSFLDFSNKTNLQSLFNGCRGLTKIDVSSMDTSMVTDMFTMFGRTGVTELDLSNFKTGKVRGFGTMFLDCPNLERITGLDKFDTSSLSYSLSGDGGYGNGGLDSMFAGCHSLRSVENIYGWDVSRVRCFKGMFQACRSLEEVDLSGWNPESLGMPTGEPWHIAGFGDGNCYDSVFDMFGDCKSLRKVNLISFDLSKVCTLGMLDGGAFDGCSSLSVLHLNNFGGHRYFDCTKGFRGCKAWGGDSKDPESFKSLWDSLVVRSFDRVKAGWPAAVVMLEKEVIDRLGREGIAAMKAKGFTVSQISDQ